jgi:hypothetical protein
LLSKQAPNLTAVAVGLGWDVRGTTGADYDFDASAIATGANMRVLSDQHFDFYNNLASPAGSIGHVGDNLTSEGEGNDLHDTRMLGEGGRGSRRRKRSKADRGRPAGADHRQVARPKSTRAPLVVDDQPRNADL